MAELGSCNDPVAAAQVLRRSMTLLGCLLLPQGGFIDTECDALILLGEQLGNKTNALLDNVRRLMERLRALHEPFSNGDDFIDSVQHDSIGRVTRDEVIRAVESGTGQPPVSTIICANSAMLSIRRP